jgi:hypothetical protein
VLSVTWKYSADDFDSGENEIHWYFETPESAPPYPLILSQQEIPWTERKDAFV